MSVKRYTILRSEFAKRYVRMVRSTLPTALHLSVIASFVVASRLL